MLDVLPKASHLPLQKSLREQDFQLTRKLQLWFSCGETVLSVSKCQVVYCSGFACKALSLFVTWMTPSYPQCQRGLLLSYQLSKTSEFLSLGHCRYWGVNSCLCLLWIPVPLTAAGTWQTKHHQEQPNFTPPLFSFLKRAELQNLNSVFQVRMVLCNAWFSPQNVA